MIEIKQNLNTFMNKNLEWPYGQWYVRRLLPDANPEMIEIGLCYDYLHNDGVWRYSTKNEEGVFSGYYGSEESAQEVLDKFS